MQLAMLDVAADGEHLELPLRFFRVVLPAHLGPLGEPAQRLAALRLLAIRARQGLRDPLDLAVWDAVVGALQTVDAERPVEACALVALVLFLVTHGSQSEKGLAETLLSTSAAQESLSASLHLVASLAEVLEPWMLTCILRSLRTLSEIVTPARARSPWGASVPQDGLRKLLNESAIP